MVKHTQKIRWQQPTNCLSVFDHFEGLALKKLNTHLVTHINGSHFGFLYNEASATAKKNAISPRFPYQFSALFINCTGSHKMKLKYNKKIGLKQRF